MLIPPANKSVPNNIILDSSKLKVFADYKINVMKKFVLGKVKNIMEKGQNVGYQHFLLFPQCFQKASFSRSLKIRMEKDEGRKLYYVTTLTTARYNQKSDIWALGCVLYELASLKRAFEAGVSRFFFLM